MRRTRGEIEATVRAGARWLDGNYQNWRKKLWTDIEVGDARKCPLAQLFGGFRKGIVAAGFNPGPTDDPAAIPWDEGEAQGWAEAHGFLASVGGGSDELAELNRAWFLATR